jgi:hypothetical protein
MWRCLNIYNLNEKKLDNRKRNAYELVLWINEDMFPKILLNYKLEQQRRTG